MLIVIVIIGILAAALIPRLTTVRARANDTARKADLQQAGTLIVAYYLEKNSFPTPAGTGLTAIWSGLGGAGATPKDPARDPNNGRIFSGVRGCGTPGEYCYQLARKNGTKSGGFIIMSYPETEGGANRVYTGTNQISGSLDTKNIIPCTSVKIDSAAGNNNNGGACTAGNATGLRYIYVF